MTLISPFTSFLTGTFEIVRLISGFCGVCGVCHFLFMLVEKPSTHIDERITVMCAQTRDNLSDFDSLSLNVFADNTTHRDVSCSCHSLFVWFPPLCSELVVILRGKQSLVLARQWKIKL